MGLMKVFSKWDFSNSVTRKNWSDWCRCSSENIQSRLGGFGNSDLVELFVQETEFAKVNLLLKNSEWVFKFIYLLFKYSIRWT
jgi:hypothetical protein